MYILCIIYVLLIFCIFSFLPLYHAENHIKKAWTLRNRMSMPSFSNSILLQNTDQSSFTGITAGRSQASTYPVRCPFKTDGIRFTTGAADVT